jgi:hypothetical protein
MLAEVYGSSEPEIPLNCVKTHARDERPQTSSEQGELHEERARNLDLLDQIDALEDEIFGCNLQKAIDDLRIGDLEDELKVKAAELSECRQELERSRESNA